MKQLFLIVLLAACSGAAPELPDLAWSSHSDWISAKERGGAKGDGLADDTNALQAALDALTPQRNTLYIPPGTYRITRTLVLRKRDGIALIGSGRATRIVWDGPGGKGDDSRMLWSDGAPRSRYIGMTWDGNHKAHVGFDHDSHTLFETEIDHRDEAFVNFTGSGLRVGHNQRRPDSLASAETTIRNCLFLNCEQGASILDFNDYNFSFSGCHFGDCGTAINGGTGCNFYVRDSRFERSRKVDLFFEAVVSCSVRRCVSVGAARFIEHACVAPLTVQDCQVTGWSNPEGAISLRGAPILIFDCTFSAPPNRNPPIVPSPNLRLVLSNNASPQTEGVVRKGAQVTVVPPGARGPALRSTDERFFSSAPRAQGRIFDARKDFQARGDGRADDTAAIQATIDAARTTGQGAIAYLPTGDYLVSSTLRMNGADYTLGGSGTHTQLVWRGPAGGTILHVEDPRNLTLENLEVGAAGNQSNGIDILHTASGASSMRYERVWVYGTYSKKPFLKGLVFQNLTREAVVVGDHLHGNLRFTNSAPATMLFNSSYEGAIVVEGKARPGPSGMLGFQTRLATINTVGLTVRDSQSIVMSDYYVESADRLMDFQGNPDDPAGHVTIQMPKSHCLKNPGIDIQNYRGRIAIGPAMFYPGMVNPVEITHAGSNPFSLTFVTNYCYHITPIVRVGESGSLSLVQNEGKPFQTSRPAVEDLNALSDALDDLRLLGAQDLALNHAPWSR